MARCELCRAKAWVYCEADRASLCWECDENVHCANFLVARHARVMLCQECGCQTLWRASGAVFDPVTCICASCLAEESKSRQNTRYQSGSASPICVISAAKWQQRNETEDSDIDSSSSTGSCCEAMEFQSLQSNNSKVTEGEEGGFKRRLRGNTERVLNRWHGELRLSGRNIVPIALNLFRKLVCAEKLCLERSDAWTVLAVCLWMAIKLDGFQFDLPSATQFEMQTGVSAEMIAMSEVWILQSLPWLDLKGCQ